MWASRDVSPEGLPRTARHTALRLPPAGPSGLLAASRGGASGGGALERGDRRVPGLLGGGNALLRRVEVLLQACAQALLGVQGGLCPSVVELGGLPRVALLAELALKRGVLGSGVLLDAVGPVNGGLGARVGLLGAPLGGGGPAARPARRPDAQSSPPALRRCGRCRSDARARARGHARAGPRLYARWLPLAAARPAQPAPRSAQPGGGRRRPRPRPPSGPGRPPRRARSRPALSARPPRRESAPRALRLARAARARRAPAPAARPPSAPAAPPPAAGRLG